MPTFWTNRTAAGWVAAGWIAAEERPWTEIPVVRWVGLVIGAVLLWAAIRAMFTKRK